jgi:site-specific recombinase XerD
VRVSLATLLDRDQTPATLLTHLTGGRMWVDATTARRLVEERGADLRSVVLDDTGAVVRESERVSASSTQQFACGLRAFLRFCFMEGLTTQDLSAAALSVTGRRRDALPRGIPVSDAKALLDSCDRRSSQGRRDYAVLVVLLRLGLRAGEVASMRLEDIDWRAAEVTVAGKGGRRDRLPLSAEVGEAIAGYLTRGRPKNTADRHVFLRAIAPIGAVGRGGVSSIVRRACRRAGIEQVGAHRLRHTVACQMVVGGASLSEVGQLLRHRSQVSSAIYGRVDVEALRGLARPWPGAVTR